MVEVKHVHSEIHLQSKQCTFSPSTVLEGIDDSSYTENEGLNSSEGDIYETNMFQGGQ